MWFQILQSFWRVCVWRWKSPFLITQQINACAVPVRSYNCIKWNSKEMREVFFLSFFFFLFFSFCVRVSVRYENFDRIIIFLHCSFFFCFLVKTFRFHRSECVFHWKRLEMTFCFFIWCWNWLFFFSVRFSFRAKLFHLYSRNCGSVMPTQNLIISPLLSSLNVVFVCCTVWR